MALTSGRYLTKVEKEVAIWPAPDPNGDGPDVWQQRFDDSGRGLERVLAKDALGNVIKEYLPPEGFQNRPSYDHSNNYVLVDERGQIVRQPNGEAINIKPGQAIVLLPDGSTEVLPDEYAQYLFNKSHDPVEVDE